MCVINKWIDTRFHAFVFLQKRIAYLYFPTKLCCTHLVSKKTSSVRLFFLPKYVECMCAFVLPPTCVECLVFPPVGLLNYGRSRHSPFDRIPLKHVAKRNWRDKCVWEIVLLALGSCDRASWAKCEERESQQHATIGCLLSTSVSTCFGHHYAHLQENKDRVLLHMVYCAGSAGCGW